MKEGAKKGLFGRESEKKTKYIRVFVQTYFVNTGKVEPMMCRRAKRRARVDRQSTMRRRVASVGHQFVARDGAFPLATFCIKCFISFM